MHAPELTADLPSRSAPEQASKDLTHPARLGVEYFPAAAALPGGMLAIVRFGAVTAAQRSPHAWCVDVQLEPLAPAGYLECWRASGRVEQGSMGPIRYASDAQHLFAVVELDERELGGVRATAQTIYAQLHRFQQHSGFPHLLRIWNYLDAINQGDGDAERYRQFCVGRAEGLGAATAASYPAATAIGHRHATGRLQVYWLASRIPGTYIENPRQVSAYRYPRVHGPVSPTFARATLAGDGTLLISGTASIVGHVSRHVGDPLAQLDETLRNLATLGAPARLDDECQTAPTARSLLKVYLRNAADLDSVAQRVRAAFPHGQVLFLCGDICRGELSLEIELVRLTT